MKINKFIFQSFDDTQDDKNNHNVNFEALKEEDLQESSNSNLKGNNLKTEEEVTKIINFEGEEKTTEQLNLQFFNEGYNKAMAEISDKVNREKEIEMEFFENLNKNIDNIMEKITQSENEMDNEIINLSLKIAKKIAGKALEEAPEKSLFEIIEKNLNLINSNKSISLTVNEAMGIKIEAYFQSKGIDSSKVKIETKADLKPTDFTLNWEGGKLEANKQKFIEKIEREISQIKFNNN